MGTLNKDNSLSDRCTIAMTNKTKRNHSSSSDQSSPHIPTNKNKKLFFSINWFEVLSQDDPPLVTILNDNNADSI